MTPARVREGYASYFDQLKTIELQVTKVIVLEYEIALWNNQKPLANMDEVERHLIVDQAWQAFKAANPDKVSFLNSIGDAGSSCTSAANFVRRNTYGGN